MVNEVSSAVLIHFEDGSKRLVRRQEDALEVLVANTSDDGKHVHGISKFENVWVDDEGWVWTCDDSVNYWEIGEPYEGEGPEHTRLGRVEELERTFEDELKSVDWLQGDEDGQDV